MKILRILEGDEAAEFLRPAHDHEAAPGSSEHASVPNQVFSSRKHSMRDHDIQVTEEISHYKYIILLEICSDCITRSSHSN
jgi:hypothetical protein